jgi:hypothetical protein
MDNESTDSPVIPITKKSPLIFRVLLKLMIVFFILLFLAIGAAFVIGRYYQDEVKEYIIGELNKQLNTQIIVDGKDIDFTLLKNFPYASVDFKNVKAMEVTESNKKDTLFKARTISMQFNLVDLKIVIDKNGNDNYHFWKPSTDSASTAFSFSLEKIVLKQISLSYRNYKMAQNINVLIKKSNLSGDFSNKKYSLETVSDLFVNQIKIDNTIYLRKKNIHAEVALMVDNEMPSYKIEKSKIKLEDLLFEVVGNVVNANKEPIVNIGIRSKDMDIKSVLSLIPNKYKGRINDYQSTGEMYLSATVQGSFADNLTPEIRADFGIKNADITQVKDNIVLHNVNLKGFYTNGNKANAELSQLTLIPFSASIEQGSISGELSMRNLDNPTFDGNIKANIGLEQLQRFVKIDTIETISGQLKMDAVYSGKALNENSNAYKNIIASGTLTLENMNVKLKNNPLQFANINGSFKFDNNDLETKELTGNISSSDFQLKGLFRNVIAFMMEENQDITIEATLNSKNINLNELLANKDEESASKNKYKLKFSDHINVNLSSQIDHLEFRKFDATNIHGTIKLKDRKLMVDPISLSTMGGNITTSGLIDASDSAKVSVSCFSDMSKINITKMFEEFENFGQTSLTNKNLKGLATAKIQFASVLSPELQIDLDKLYTAIDMTIENGELINVESMKSMSRFIELNELNDVRFATLKNQIEIKNKVITIPKMEVKSNTVNVTASGTHTFNNEINYKVKLSLNDLLSKKVRKAKKENDEFGVVSDDGLGRTNIFLSMTGTVDNPIIKYDSKSAIQNVKQDLKVEKQTMKTILKEEFGLFKKDTTLKINNKNPKEDVTKFLINWDENNPKKEEKKTLKRPKKETGEDY